VVTATVVVDDGAAATVVTATARLLLVVVAASNEVGVASSGVVVGVVTECEAGGCVTVDDRVTSPFTPDASDAFDEFAD